MALSLMIVGTGLLALGGCASTTDQGKRALVCPQCKTVEMTVDRPTLGFEYRGAMAASGARKRFSATRVPAAKA